MMKQIKQNLSVSHDRTIYECQGVNIPFQIHLLNLGFIINDECKRTKAKEQQIQ